MFGAKYSRLRFWIISMCLFVMIAFLNLFAKAIESGESPDDALVFYVIIFTLSLIWLNTLANRIRDYGSNPWYALFALIPLVNFGLALYYGIIKSATKEDISNNSNTSNSSLAKAVYNHSKDIANEIKPKVEGYKDKHSQQQTTTVDNDASYEQALTEIEEDKKVKSTWAKALAQSEGNKDKAESLYINLRVKDLEIKNHNSVNDLNNKIKYTSEKIVNQIHLNQEELNFLTKYECNQNSWNVQIDNKLIRIQKKHNYLCFERLTKIEFKIPVSEFDSITEIIHNNELQRKYCPFCGTSNDENARICFKCKEILTLDDLITKYKEIS